MRKSQNYVIKDNQNKRIEIIKLVIIGAVAGGTSAGAKARRGDLSLEITIYKKDTDISYAACGLPYYLGDNR